jgi:hypothetical protein
MTPLRSTNGSTLLSDLEIRGCTLVAGSSGEHQEGLG